MPCAPGRAPRYESGGEQPVTIVSQDRQVPRAGGAGPAQRKLPVGAEVVPGGVHFRVWAPARRRVEVVFEGGGPAVELAPEGDGYFSGLAGGARAGSLYRYRLDGDRAYP